MLASVGDPLCRVRGIKVNKLSEFCVFTCKQETVKGLILVLFCEIRFSGSTLRRISHDSFCSSGSGFELRLTRQFFLRIRLGAWVADLASEIRLTNFFVNDSAVAANATTEVRKRHFKIVLRHNSSALFDSRRTKGSKLIMFVCRSSCSFFDNQD